MKKNTAWIRGVVWVLTGAVLFSSKAIFIKLAYRYDVTAVPLLALRMGFSFPAFAAMAAIYRRRESPEPITGRDYLFVLLTGLSGYYFASLFDFIGLEYVNAGIERLILFSYPTLVVLFSWLFFRKRISRIQAAALALTYIGIAIVMQSDLRAGSSPEQLLTGSVWIFLCSVCYALYLVSSGHLIPKYGSVRYTANAMMAASAAIFIHAALTEGASLFSYAPEVYLYAFLMAVFATILPSLLIAEGIRHIGAAPASIIGAVGPVATILMAWLVLGETITALQLLGSAIVMLGVGIISVKKE
ncbi:MAG: EamA/RhaT family transporter [Bacteroidetes bacterium]|nr:MAG: EamA/RhaT family transporter [Bacteroidota bacterium]